MISVIMMYPKTADSTFNWDYFINTHIKRIRETFAGLGLARLVLHEGVGGGMPGTPAAYMCLCEFMFETLEGFQQGFMQEGAWIMGDVPNYSSVMPQVQISTIALDQ